MGTLIFILMLIVDSKRKGEEVSAMDIFDKISDTVISTGRTVGQKAKDMSEMAKVQIELRDKKMILTSLYAELGEKYYNDHKAEELADFEEIKATLDKIDELERSLSEIKGFDNCAVCGAKLPEGAAFCPSCGAKLDNSTEEENVEEVSEEANEE